MFSVQIYCLKQKARNQRWQNSRDLRIVCSFVSVTCMQSFSLHLLLLLLYICLTQVYKFTFITHISLVKYWTHILKKN